MELEGTFSVRYDGDQASMIRGNDTLDEILGFVHDQLQRVRGFLQVERVRD